MIFQRARKFGPLIMDIDEIRSSVGSSHISEQKTAYTFEIEYQRLGALKRMCQP